MNIYDLLYEKYKPKKNIRLIETFSGYGSQALALKYLGIDFEHWKTCEWAIKSIQAYKDIHFTNETYNSNLTKEEYVDYLFSKGISSNYNDPMTYEQIKRMKEKDLKIIYDNIQITHNLVNIQQVKGKDLDIIDTYKYDYILTYSFPCQDLSLAGKGKGMSDTSTRSGMLWEVERILTECKEIGNLPQILLMENVPQVHSQDNVEDFNKWQLILERLGYSNYWQDLIATDYRIPQIRNRCFMISILGEYNYKFPKPIPLKLKERDILEKKVNKKYYLSKKMLDYIVKENPNYTGNNGKSLINKNNFSTITTREGNTKCDTSNYVSNVLPSNFDLKVFKNLEIYKGKQAGSIYNINYLIPTLTTKSSLNWNILIEENFLKIRKLTPKECFRLMGVKDEDFEKVRVNQSDSSLYHLAGDSIVVNVLMAIFGELFEINWQDYLQK